MTEESVLGILPSALGSCASGVSGMQRDDTSGKARYKIVKLDRKVEW